MADDGSASLNASVRASTWVPIALSGAPTVEIHGMETVWLVFELNHEPPAIWISSFERQAARNGSPQLRAHTAPGVDGATICWVVADDDAVLASHEVLERVEAANRAYAVYLRAKEVEQQQATIHPFSDPERIASIEAKLRQPNS